MTKMKTISIDGRTYVARLQSRHEGGVFYSLSPVPGECRVWVGDGEDLTEEATALIGALSEGSRGGVSEAELAEL
jgi:hypothetical protein